MNRITRWSLVVLGGGLLMGLTTFPWWMPGEKPHRPMEDWSIDDLVQHLRKSGLEFRVFGTFQDGRTCWGAFLTTTDKSWDDLTSLAVAAERLPEWKGTVRCTWIGKGGLATESMIQLWGDGGERLGPFGLFGDPEVRAKIRWAVVSESDR
jgi:hypothetical protein